MDELPRNTRGKVQKKAMQSRYDQLFESNSSNLEGTEHGDHSLSRRTS